MMFSGHLMKEKEYNHYKRSPWTCQDNMAVLGHSDLYHTLVPKIYLDQYHIIC